ncbi:MAG: acetyl-CoA C-acetyltransferase, partial [Sphingomonadales bacterium]|nr:acetyl-CoA C-acetyltransferase [Sphingomonadales bacterium]
MTDAVIVAAGRSPIGRASKGSLVDVRPDELAAQIICRVLDKVPSLPAEQIEDLICGTASPAGEQGHNLARVLGILTRLNTPGTTVNRYCSSSLQTTRMAAHAIWAGEGHAFLSVGVECVSRYPNGMANTREGANQRLLPGNPEGYPDIYIAMGLTAENVARQEHVTR